MVIIILGKKLSQIKNLYPLSFKKSLKQEKKIFEKKKEKRKKKKLMNIQKLFQKYSTKLNINVQNGHYQSKI